MLLTKDTVCPGMQITYNSERHSLCWANSSVEANRWIHSFGPYLTIDELCPSGRGVLVKVPDYIPVSEHAYRPVIYWDELLAFNLAHGDRGVIVSNLVHAEDAQQQLSALQRPIAKTYRMSDTHDQYNRSIGLNARGDKVTMVFRVTKAIDRKQHVQRMSFTPQQARDMAVQLQHIADKLEASES